MKGFWAEFRNFAVKGNALELAFAVVIGTAFTAVINSLVNDIITPLLGLVTGNGATDVKTYALTMNGVAVKYGSFLSTVINFLLISLSIFLVFKLISSARKKLFRQGEAAVPPAEKPAQERLLEEIRDLLKDREVSPEASVERK
jgi:large conductance mechanosensitive channel